MMDQLLECRNAAVPLLYALNSLLRTGLCSAASIFFLDKNKARVCLALSPSERGIEARRVSVPLSGDIFSSVAASGAILLNGPNASPLVKALFPDSCFPDSGVTAVPMHFSGNREALLAALYSPKGAESAGESGCMPLISQLSSLAKSAAESYSRIADFSALPPDALGLSGKPLHSDAVTESQIMKEKLAVVKAVADSDSPILFIGESGTGREFFARKLHGFSRRAAEPFVRINCPAFSDALLEKMLFGTEQESPRSAQSGEDELSGLLEKADTGTVLFKGIESLSASMQEKLVRALQAGSIEKEGDPGAVPIRARIAASTDCDLEKLVAEKKFRADLYYTLSVIPLYLPPLAARREDILSLAYMFMKHCAFETGKPFLFFSSGAEKALLDYSWPGNVRELKNAVARACMSGTPPCVTEDDLLLNNRLILDNNMNADRNLKSAITVFKKQYIAQILAENGWNQSASAKVLGIQRTYLSRLVKELKIREQ